MAERARMLVAVHLLLLQADKILLLRRFNTGYEDGNYSVIAGHVDAGEEVKAAMIREAGEEAGIAISPADLQVVGVMHRRAADERIDFFMACARWSGAVTNREPEKCDDLAWFSPDALPANVIPYVRRAIGNYRRGVAFDSFGWDESGADDGVA